MAPTECVFSQSDGAGVLASFTGLYAAGAVGSKAVANFTLQSRSWRREKEENVSHTMFVPRLKLLM